MNIYLPLTLDLATRLELHTCIELTHSSDNVISCPKQLNDVYTTYLYSIINPITRRL